MLARFIFVLSIHAVFPDDVVFYPSKHGFKTKTNIATEFQNNVHKREVDTSFHGHPKTREELWNMHFLNENNNFDQNPSLIHLLHTITMKHLNDCTPVVLYDKQVEMEENYLIRQLFIGFPLTYIHGRINDDNTLAVSDMIVPVNTCLNFIVFLEDVMRTGNVIGIQATSKVVVVARSSQWRVQEFLSSRWSRMFVNLLVIGQTFKDDDASLEAPYILYTHKLYTDGLGASQPVVLTSWTRGKFTRDVNLFPDKIVDGYAGHRFIVTAANQPPYVFRSVITDLDGGNPRVVWDGVEIRILKMLGAKYNFSIEFKDPKNLILGSGDAVAADIKRQTADIGVGGLYLTSERLANMDMSFPHSQDCAVFITLMSTALPRYRAIMGPFHWHVWLALTFTYMFGILPLAFSDKHTLKHLWGNPGEVENMFWYVFGTFTNCFTFVGKNSWSKTTKLTTRLLIGWYWIFTIIITSCYTGSIIAFVTLPVYPETVDTIDQLLRGFYRIGTLDRGGWERWFFNSTDKKTNKLLQKLELVSDIREGIMNTTKAFFWPYAFLGSQAELEYMVQANFSSISTSKRAVLHISDRCFARFGVSIAFTNQSIFTKKLNAGLSRMFQSGLIRKIYSEVKWDMQRGQKGQRLAAGSGALKITSSDENGLTLDDTQGMFLLLAAGFLIAAAVLLSEWMGGCNRKCQFKGRRKISQISEGIPPTEVDLDGKRQSDQTQTIEYSNIDEVVGLKQEDFESADDIAWDGISGKTESSTDEVVVKLTKELFDIHDNFDFSSSSEKRYSSASVNREIEEIFDMSGERRRMIQSAEPDRSSSRFFGEKI